MTSVATSNATTAVRDAVMKMASAPSGRNDAHATLVSRELDVTAT